MKIFIVVVICSLVLSIASLKINNSDNIENNQNDFFNYLVDLIEHKSQYKLKAFPYVKKIFSKVIGKIIVLIIHRQHHLR